MATLSLQAELQRVKSRVDHVILSELLPQSSELREVNLLYRMMRDYPGRPAKGLRPFLCIAACKAAGGTEDQVLLTAACIELFHHWILIHDDLEDGSELRRGEPTLHQKYSVPLALNAGDALHARGWGALLTNQRVLSFEKTLHVMEEFSRIVNETTEGQHMELAWVQQKRWDLTETDYCAMCTKKTSWYTVAGPCRLGAIVASASDDVLEGLTNFGLALGVAFQIQDDLLNLSSDRAKYGKTRSDDICEGKRTLVLLRVLQCMDSNERTRFNAIMEKDRTERSSDEVAYVLSLVDKYGALDYAAQRSLELMEQAIGTLATIRWRGDWEAVVLLESVAKFAVERVW